MINQIKETSLYVKDLENTRKFYEGKLGFKVIARVDGRHIFFRAGDSILLCFLSDATKSEGLLPSHFATGKIHIAFEVALEEYFKCKAEIKLAGIEIIQEQQWRSGLKSFYFRDPDGHLLEILQEGVWDI